MQHEHCQQCENGCGQCPRQQGWAQPSPHGSNSPFPQYFPYPQCQPYSPYPQYPQCPQYPPFPQYFPWQSSPNFQQSPFPHQSFQQPQPSQLRSQLQQSRQPQQQQQRSSILNQLQEAFDEQKGQPICSCSEFGCNQSASDAENEYQTDSSNESLTYGIKQGKSLLNFGQQALDELVGERQRLARVPPEKVQAKVEVIDEKLSEIQEQLQSFGQTLNNLEKRVAFLEEQKPKVKACELCPKIVDIISAMKADIETKEITLTKLVKETELRTIQKILMALQGEQAELSSKTSQASTCSCASHDVSKQQSQEQELIQQGKSIEPVQDVFEETPVDNEQEFYNGDDDDEIGHYDESSDIEESPEKMQKLLQKLLRDYEIISMRYKQASAVVDKNDPAEMEKLIRLQECMLQMANLIKMLCQRLGIDNDESEAAPSDTPEKDFERPQDAITTTDQPSEPPAVGEYDKLDVPLCDLSVKKESDDGDWVNIVIEQSRNKSSTDEPKDNATAPTVDQKEQSTESEPSKEESDNLAASQEGKNASQEVPEEQKEKSSSAEAAKKEEEQMKNDTQKKSTESDSPKDIPRKE